MMKALLAVRFRAMLAAMTAQGRRKNGKTRGKGYLIFLGLIYAYLAVVICGMMGVTFYTLAIPYHEAGLDWLYFSMAGLMGLGFSVIGSVFSTQSGLYDARDNALLLAMPIKPSMILLSRMIPLLLLNLICSGLVFLPAMVVYGLFIETSVELILLQLLALLGTTLLAQAIACALGWVMHLLLAKLNKSVASLVFMVGFLAIYFTLFSQIETVLNTIAMEGQAIASVIQSWVWPLYGLGLGCLGDGLAMLGFLAVAAGVFAAVYWLLSVTFLPSAAMASRSRGRRPLSLAGVKARSPMNAVVYKEWRKFLGSPVYLTNMGLGVILTAALPVAAVIFRGELLPLLELVGFRPLLPLLICAVFANMSSMSCISTPSVSLEGKNLWILKSLPISSRDILLGKLTLHCRLTIPVSMAAGAVVAAAYGCDWLEIGVCMLLPGLTSLLSGLVGMLSGLQWAKFDYISEAYPCKQSISVAVSMFAIMGLTLLLGLAYGVLLVELVEPTVFLWATALLLGAGCFGLYQLLTRWGVRKWETL